MISTASNPSDAAVAKDSSRVRPDEETQKRAPAVVRYSTIFTAALPDGRAGAALPVRSS